MTKTYNVAEAKAHLSRLIEQAESGDEVVLARAGRPVARLVPIVTPPARELGFLHLDTPDERFDALGADELAAWS